MAKYERNKSPAGDEGLVLPTKNLSSTTLSFSFLSSSSYYSFIFYSLIPTGGVGGDSTWKQLGGQCQASPHHLFPSKASKAVGIFFISKGGLMLLPDAGMSAAGLSAV